MIDITYETWEDWGINMRNDDNRSKGCLLEFLN
jgi:hypothetical protein